MEYQVFDAQCPVCNRKGVYSKAQVDAEGTIQCVNENCLDINSHRVRFNSPWKPEVKPDASTVPAVDPAQEVPATTEPTEEVPNEVNQQTEPQTHTA